VVAHRTVIRLWIHGPKVLTRRRAAKCAIHRYPRYRHRSPLPLAGEVAPQARV